MEAEGLQFFVREEVKSSAVLWARSAEPAGPTAEGKEAASPRVGCLQVAPLSSDAFPAPTGRHGPEEEGMARCQP